ncbi:hypothetical protein [Kitasatospora sp. NPDC001175]|uniref:hypothetical protein n=1 Tax=Kitasatospora sp. NPDC001175 TaxID=3157103 RepID=UPI003CFFF5CD
MRGDRPRPCARRGRRADHPELEDPAPATREADDDVHARLLAAIEEAAPGR